VIVEGNRTWIPTFSGRRFDVMNVDESAISIADIAHALSNICRFTGHTRVSYSVAQHSVNVSFACSDPRYGLLHDASEAYLADIASPVKHSDVMAAYRDVERTVQSAIYKKFGLDMLREPADLHEADVACCSDEISELVRGHQPPTPPSGADLVPMTPREAERAFLQRFDALFPEFRSNLATRPSWDDTWMSIARQISQRSTDPRLRVGAVIVTSDNTSVLSLGYNGGYAGGPNDPESPEPGKSGFVHAELNAVIKLDYHDHHDRVMYVTHSPCVSCAKCIINARIRGVIYEADYRDASGVELLRRAGVSVSKHKL